MGKDRTFVLSPSPPPLNAHCVLPLLGLPLFPARNQCGTVWVIVICESVKDSNSFYDSLNSQTEKHPQLEFKLSLFRMDLNQQQRNDSAISIVHTRSGQNSVQCCYQQGSLFQEDLSIVANLPPPHPC